METSLNILGIDYLWDISKRIYLPFLLSALIVGIIFLRKKNAREYFSKSIWWHVSARLDYLMFFISSTIKALVLLPLLYSALEVATYTKFILFFSFGYFPIIILEHSQLIILYSVSLFLLSDLSRYGLHRLMHKNNFLWQFHKIHHSAEVLTPFTFYRVHPFENLLFAVRYMLVAGILTGIFSYLFGAGLSIISILGINIFTLLSHALLANLRHSHVHIGFGALEKVFISPAQHQIHHSQTGNQYNYGGVLAIWDKMFKSIKVSKPFKQYQFGITSSAQYRTITQLLLKPFGTALK